MYEEENSLEPIVQGNIKRIRGELDGILRIYKYDEHPSISQELADYLTALVSSINTMIRNIVENEEEELLIGKRLECVQRSRWRRN